MTMLPTASLLRLKRRQDALNGLRPTVGAASSNPAWPSGTSLIAHLRVDDATRHVGDDVGQDDDAAIEDGDAHHQRIVAVGGALDEIAADAGNAEYLFDHHRARHGDRGGRPEVG